MQSRSDSSDENKEEMMMASDEKSGNSENGSDAVGEDSDDEKEEVGKDEESEDEEYVVEKILDKRYNRRKRRIEYLIKWAGYDNENENTWESAENCVSSLIL